MPPTLTAVAPSGGPTWQAEGNFAGAEFGGAVAPAGDVNHDGYSDIIVGSPGYDTLGRASVYLGSILGVAAQPAWTVFGVQKHFGASVSGAGDINGDGFDDVVVGEPDANLGVPPVQWTGQVSLYLGSAAGPAKTPAWVGHAGLHERFGASVASAGDVNDDGYGDIIVGAPGESGTIGHAYVFLGSASGLMSSWMAWDTTSTAPDQHFGAAVAGAGDVNRDGFDDVIVGEPDYVSPAPAPLGGCTIGRAFVYLGSPRGLSTTPAWVMNGDANCANLESTHFGCSVASAGDVDGDGFDDVVIGCAKKGSLLVLGSSSGTLYPTTWSAPGNARGAGDVNGDHFDDIVVGFPAFSHDQVSEGEVSLYLGGPAGPSLTPAWTVEGNQSGAGFGAAVAGAGDTDGDGRGNILVGAPFYDDGQTDEGAAFEFFGAVATPCAQDGDGDGYCSSGPGADCDDTDPSVHPNATEICNGRDDNCDGSIDEGFGTGAACTSGLGVCAVAGVTACAADGSLFCDSPPPGTPSPEVCDGLDNDCDGVIDDGLDCRPTIVAECVSFTSPLGKGSGTVSWRTELETGVTGFNVIQIDSRGARIQLNPALIPCEECVTRKGHTYAFFVPKHKSGQSIYIEMAMQNGTVQTFGPALKDCTP